MLLAGLIIIALGLTGTMFATKQSMLGFPSAIFWALLGGQAYTQSTIPWGDIYFFLFFASMFGMVIFTAFAAYGLREKRDTIADESMAGDGGFIDEEDEPMSSDEDKHLELNDKPRKRTQALRERAEARRSRTPKRKS